MTKTPHLPLRCFFNWHKFRYYDAPSGYWGFWACVLCGYRSDW